jgi:predicted nucleic acid-binding protein
VSNASPLIALEQIGQLSLLAPLFSSVAIPPAVAREVAPTMNIPVWIVARPLSQSVPAGVSSALLGAGESETLPLAVEAGASWVVLDDRAARRLAQQMGLSVIGTLGVLLAAKRQNMVAAVKPSLDNLAAHGFHIADDLYRRVLADAEESPP